MSDENKHNLLYFEAGSMKELFDTMQAWQIENNKRLLSLNVETDSGKFCCIALTNPTEVVITDRHGSEVIVWRQRLSVATEAATP